MVQILRKHPSGRIRLGVLPTTLAVPPVTRHLPGKRESRVTPIALRVRNKGPRLNLLSGESNGVHLMWPVEVALRAN